jgi:hypothetical protein
MRSINNDNLNTNPRKKKDIVIYGIAGLSQCNINL